MTTIPALRRAAEPAYPAAAAAGMLGTLGLIWTVTGRGFPFGPADDGNDANLLRAVPPEVGAPVVAAVLLATAVAALALAGSNRPPALVRNIGLAAGWAVVAALLVVMPDMRLLALLGYAPMLLVLVPLGMVSADWGTLFDATLGTQVLSVVTGVLLARALLTWQLRTAGLCGRCGRGLTPSAWANPAAAARWGRWATWIAAGIPVVYAATRLSWVLGIPFGISAEGLRTVKETGGQWAGAGLATFALVGAALTIGLVQRWGEVFPRWIPGLAGRPVPVKLATVPAATVSVLALSAGISLLSVPGVFDEPAQSWPATLWPVWALALGAATLAYHLRRRSGCPVCGRS